MYMLQYFVYKKNCDFKRIEYNASNVFINNDLEEYIRYKEK